MSGADLFEDGFPHGTEKGYDDGCRGGSCPAGLEHGLTCKRAKQLAAGDYRYKRLVRQGLTPAEIAAELSEKPHEPHHAPEPAHKRRDIDAPAPITTTRPMRQPEEPTVPTPKDVAKPNPKPTAPAKPAAPQPEQSADLVIGTTQPTLENVGPKSATAAAPLTTDKWTQGLNQRDKTAKLGEIRAWARDNGFPGVPTHGKIPQAALAAYDAAHPLPGEPGSGFDRMPGAELVFDGEVVAVTDEDGVMPAFTVADDRRADDNVVVTALTPRPVPGGIIPALLAREAEASIALDGETIVIDGPAEGEPALRSDMLDETRERIDAIPDNWCPNKQRFETADDADAALARIREKRLGRGATKVEHRSYACPHCEGWHLTSQPLRHGPRELHNTVADAAPDQAFVASKVPSTGMRAWPTNGTRGPAVVREVRSILDSNYATQIMQEVPTGVRVTWLPEDDDARQGIDWLDEVTPILPVGAFKYDRFGSDDMAETLNEWVKAGRTWHESLTDITVVNVPSAYPPVSTIAEDIRRLESTTPQRPEDKYSFAEKAGLGRPDWADVTIPEDIAKARTLAARLEEENAQLVQALADKDVQIAALDEHAADTRRHLAIAEHDAARVTGAIALVLQMWASEKDEVQRLSGFINEYNTVVADFHIARRTIREREERIGELELQLEVEKAVNDRLTQLPVAEVVEASSLRRPWWKRGGA